MGIEKAFDSLDHDFLISALKKYAVAKNFIWWVKILSRNQELRVLNGRTTTKYFLLGRGARQISAYLFILALEILFHLSLRLKDLQSLTIATFTLHILTIQPFSHSILSLQNTWLILFNFFRTFLF